MKKKILLSVICALIVNANASDLGTIQVESSTIDDKFESKMLEVSNTTTVTGAKIEEFHSKNIADVLNTVPGVTVRRNEGDSNKIHIRGIAAEMYMGEKPGVAIVIDGVPVQERAGSINIDSDNIESIKVIKGGASYLYGNDALAGAVIITTKKAKNKNEAFVSTEQGSYGYAKYIASFTGGTEDLAVRFQASSKESDGYWEDSDYWAKSLNGKLQYYIDDSSDITLGIDKSTRFENDTGSITYATFDGTPIGNGVYTNNVETNPTSKGEVGYAVGYEIELSKYFLTYAKDFDNGLSLMSQIYNYEDITTNKSSAIDTVGDGVRDDHLYSSFADTLQQGFKTELRTGGDTLAAMLGIDIARNTTDRDSKVRVDYTSRGTLYAIGDVASNNTNKEDINAIYGELKYGITNALTTTLNARYDQIKYNYSNHLDSSNWDKEFNEASYRLGATYKLEATSVIYTNGSTGFRVPLISQLFAGDITGTSRGITYENNINMKTEKTYNVELGYRSKSDMLTYDIAIYQLSRNDVIAKSTGNYSSPDGSENVSYGNMSDIRNRGLELSLNSNRAKDFSFAFNYTYLDSIYTKYDNFALLLEGETTSTIYDLGGNTVPRTSNHTFYLEGTYKIMSNWSMTADVNYRTAQFADERNMIEVDGYAVANLRTKYNLNVSIFDIELFAQVDNVLNEQYYMMPRVTGDRNDDGIYDVRDMGLTVNPGRVYLAGLSAKF